MKPKSELAQGKSHKKRHRRKRKKRSKSILHEKDGTCYLCRMLHDDWTLYEYTEQHHIFFGTAKRALSEEHGLKVHLCIAHHRGNAEGSKEAVHRNKKINLLLRAEGQAAFETTHTREEFRQIFFEDHLTVTED